MDSWSNVANCPSSPVPGSLPLMRSTSTSECTTSATGATGGTADGTQGTDNLSESGKATLAEPVLKCLSALDAAETDTEKLAALFLVPKLVKGADCDKNARSHIMKGIGFPFLARMLRSKDTPEGCPQLMYQSVALSVLSCFTNDEEIMTNPSVLFNLPVLLDIVNDADNKVYEENLLIVNDAYEILTAIVATETGRHAFINNRGIHYLCEINIQQSFQCEKALSLLLCLLQFSGQTCWLYHSGTEDFNNLMNKFCREFAVAQDQSKFELCESLRVLIRSYPKANFEEEPWLPHLHRGLKDILMSKISKEQRDPALKLLATVIETADFEWCIADLEGPDGRRAAAGAGDRGKFLLVIVNLACIEVIMQLEEKKLHEAIENAELLVSCYSIIESAVAYLANERLTALDAKQTSQLCTAIKNAFSTILKFLNDMSIHLKDDHGQLDEANARNFVCSTIRILCAWLAEETMANREEVYDILPFIITLAIETFEAQKLEKLQSLPGRGSSNFTSFSGETMLKRQGEEIHSERTPDVFRYLLPGLCHLVAEDKPRKIVLNLRVLETLHTYLSFHWSIFNSLKAWLQEQETAENNDDVVEPSYLIENARFEMVSSKYALTSICNILMNVTVLEPKLVADEQIFFHVLKFVMNNLPSVENKGETLVLYGNFCVLGLLILKSHSYRLSSSDFHTYKFVQGVIRFFWDAYNCEESPGESEMSVSSTYLEHWTDIEELWLLGMQVLASLVEPLPWIGEFVRESGWPFEIVRTLEKVDKDCLQSGPKMAFDDLLGSLVRTGEAHFREDLKKKHGVITVCQRHHMKEFASALSGKSKPD